MQNSGKEEWVFRKPMLEAQGHCDLWVQFVFSVVSCRRSGSRSPRLVEHFSHFVVRSAFAYLTERKMCVCLNACGHGLVWIVLINHCVTAVECIEPACGSTSDTQCSFISTRKCILNKKETHSVILYTLSCYSELVRLAFLH